MLRRTVGRESIAPMSKLNPILQQVYNNLKKDKTPEEKPVDWPLIAAAKVAAEKLQGIYKELMNKRYQLVEVPEKVREDLGNTIVSKEQQIIRLQKEIAEAKIQYKELEGQWVEGMKSYEAIELYYQPQIIALKTQADYVPLAQRATVSRRRKQKKPKNDVL